MEGKQVEGILAKSEEEIYEWEDTYNCLKK